MKDSTKELHNSLIRSAKGAITAWEKWLKEQAGESNAEDVVLKITGGLVDRMSAGRERLSRAAKGQESAAG